MSEQTMEDILNALYDLIQDARNAPLSADKCVVERDKVLDMLDEVMSKLPAELKQSRTIVDSRNDLIAQARREAASHDERAHPRRIHEPAPMKPVASPTRYTPSAPMMAASYCMKRPPWCFSALQHSTAGRFLQLPIGRRPIKKGQNTTFSSECQARFPAIL